MTEEKTKTGKEQHLAVRLVVYFIGLFIMTLGISMSVKSNLGVSPVSSIPYTITCIFGLEMGKATIVFHVFLVILQILILRWFRRYRNGNRCDLSRCEPWYHHEAVRKTT